MGETHDIDDKNNEFDYYHYCSGGIAILVVLVSLPS